MPKILKKILIILLIVIILSGLSFAVYITLKKLNITNIKTLKNFISKFGIFAPLVFVSLQVLISTPIFVIPFEDELWVTLALLMFDVKTAFILSVIAMMIISINLYFIGKNLSEKLIVKLIGEKGFYDVQSKFKSQNSLALPFLYMIPFLPHDTLCVVSGSAKTNFWYFAFVTLIIRSIEIVGVCFLGGGVIKWGSLTAFDWLILINFVIIDVYLLFKLKNYMENRIKNKKDKT